MSVFKYDPTALNKLVKGLQSIPKAVEKATSRSINRTLTTVRKDITGQVRDDYNIKAGAFKDGMPIEKATISNLEGKLYTAGGPGVPLIDFQARSRVSPSHTPSTKWRGEIGHRIAGPKRGVAGLVRMSTGRTRWRGAFVARMRSGYRGVFVRVPGKRMGLGNKPAIREMYGPSAARILVNGRYTKETMTLVSSTMRKNMLQETRFIIRKLGKL